MCVLTMVKNSENNKTGEIGGLVTPTQGRSAEDEPVYTCISSGGKKGKVVRVI